MSAISCVFPRSILGLTFVLFCLPPAYATVITFEDLPDAYFFNTGGQNIGNFYSGITFGPNVAGLSVARFGVYASDAFPPHSGDVVIWDAVDPRITINFASPITSFGIWYTSFDPLRLQGFDAANNLLSGVVGTPNSDGTTGATSFLYLANSAITSVDLTSLPGLFTLDDLTFQSGAATVPEPSTFALLATAMIGLIFCRLFRRGYRGLFSPKLALLLAVGWFGAPSLFGQTDTPPVLTAMSFSSTSVNVTSSSQSVTISLTLTNNLSGVNFNAVPFIYNELTLQSPSGMQVLGITDIGGGFVLKSGTNFDGVWQATVTIPQFSEAGLWTVVSVNVYDNAENELSMNTAQLTAAGFPTSINVISNPDVTPPTLLGLSFSPASVNTTSAPQAVTLILNLADSPAGVVFPGGSQLRFDCEIVSPSGKQTQWLSSDEFKLVSGTPQAGSWAGIFTMPQYSEPGTWTIQQLFLQDAANNSENLTGAAITALGFSPTVTVSDSSPDLTPPVLTNFTLAPQVLDTSIGPQTVVASLQATDNPAGVSFAPTAGDITFFYGPFVVNPTNTLTLYTFCNQSAGTPQHGTWQCNITMPAFSAAGAWTVSSVNLKDADNNTVSYTTAQLKALGFPTVITVEPLTAGAVFLGGGGSRINPTVLVAEPVNSATGNYFSSHVDLAVRGRGLSFQFARYYNSLDSYSGPLGPSWNHTYNILLATNSANGEVTIRQADGSTVLFAPSGGGNYTAATIGLSDTLRQNADGTFTLTHKNRTALNFTTTGHLASIVDRNGNTQTLSYDSSGNLISVTDTVGRVFTFAYNGNNQLLSVTDPPGRQVQYAYDGNGNLSSFTDAGGTVTTYSYDPSHQMASAVDARGVTYVQNTYDINGRVVKQKNGRGIATQFAYDTPSAGTTTITDDNGNAIRYVYDSNLRIVEIVNGTGGSTSYTYDANNNRTGITNANGKSTALTYDGNGNALSAQNAAGNTASFTYDSFNDLTSVTDPAGRKTALCYDSRGNLLEIEGALGAVTRYSYDAFGEILTRTDAVGNETQFGRDDAGNLVQVIDGAGRKRSFAYDAIGRMVSSTDSLNHTRKIQYDPLGRVLGRTDPLGNQTQYSYDAIGELLKVTDANGNLTSYSYDATNNLIAVVDALGQKTAYTYDGNNNRTSFTNAKGKVTSYTYDASNRRVKVTDPLGRTKGFTYDAVGDVIATTDGNDHTNHFTYDVLNRRLTSAYADGNDVSYSYDANGNRISMTDHNGTTTYGYDALNRLTSVTRFDGKVVGHAYDAVGHRSSVTYPNGHAARYQYDGSGKLTTVTDWSGNKTTYSYDAAGRLIARGLPNKVGSIYTYDAANRLLRIANVDQAAPFGREHLDQHVLSSFAYALDNVGNRLAVTSATDGTSRYGYDALYRLTSWTAPSGQVTEYTYDPVGNRTSLVSQAVTTPYTYDDADEMLTAGATSFTYDDNGSRLTRTVASATTSYAWDAVRRLISVMGSGVSIQYDYDGDGNRVAQQANASRYSYVNDVVGLTNVLNEEGSEGSLSYLYGRGQIANVGTNSTNYLTFDGIGSIATVSDSSAAPEVTYVYDPWGKLLNSVDPLGTKEKYKFAGQALDSAAGLYYMRARYYDASVGVFLSRDSFSGSVDFPLSRNRYVYARANPLRFVDPSGRSVEPMGGATTSSFIDDASTSIGLVDFSRSLFALNADFGAASMGGVSASLMSSADIPLPGGVSIGLRGPDDPPPGPYDCLQSLFNPNSFGPCSAYSGRTNTSQLQPENLPSSPDSGLGNALFPPLGGSSFVGWPYGGILNAPENTSCDITDVCGAADTQAPTTTGDTNDWNNSSDSGWGDTSGWSDPGGWDF